MCVFFVLIRTQYLAWWPPRCRWEPGSPPPPPRAALGWHAAPCCWPTGSSSSCPGRWAGLRAAGPHSHSEEALRGTAPLEVWVCRRSCLRRHTPAFVLTATCKSYEGSQTMTRGRIRLLPFKMWALAVSTEGSRGNVTRSSFVINPVHFLHFDGCLCSRKKIASSVADGGALQTK